MYLGLVDAEDRGRSSAKVDGASEFRRSSKKRSVDLGQNGASNGNGAAELCWLSSLTWFCEEMSSVGKKMAAVKMRE